MQIQIKDKKVVLSDQRSSMELLRSRIVDHGVAPIYRLLGRTTSGQKFLYNYSCTLFGMYGEWKI